MKSFKEFLKEQNEYVEFRNFWHDRVRDAMKDSNIRFDLENSDPIDEFKEHNGIKYRAWAGGGDWETPSLYFHCQQGDEMDKKTCFVFIPNKDEGNCHLIPSEKGDVHVPLDDQKELKYNKEDGEQSLKKYLDRLKS